MFWESSYGRGRIRLLLSIGGMAASIMQRADVTEPGTRGWLQRPEEGREEEGDGIRDSHPESQNCVVE